MGDAADDAFDRWLEGQFSLGRARRRKGFQTGTGNFKWRTATGEIVDMHSMSDSHLRNAINLCISRGNNGKQAQLQEVLDSRNQQPVRAPAQSLFGGFHDD